MLVIHNTNVIDELITKIRELGVPYSIGDSFDFYAQDVINDLVTGSEHLEAEKYREDIVAEVSKLVDWEEINTDQFMQDIDGEVQALLATYTILDRGELPEITKLIQDVFNGGKEPDWDNGQQELYESQNFVVKRVVTTDEYTYLHRRYGALVTKVLDEL